MKIKISLLLLFGLLLNISHQFLAALQKDQGAAIKKVKVVSFADDIPNVPVAPGKKDQVAVRVQASRDQSAARLQALRDQEMARMQAFLDRLAAYQQASRDQRAARVQALREQETRLQALEDQNMARLEAMRHQEMARQQAFRDQDAARLQAMRHQEPPRLPPLPEQPRAALGFEKYTNATNELLELTALQKLLKEKGIKKVGQFQVGYFNDLNQRAGNAHVLIGNEQVPLHLNLYLKIIHILHEKEEKIESSCCCWSTYRLEPRYGHNCDLSIVFDRVKSILQVIRPHNDNR